jgi:HK97 family phage major capsid protein
MTLSEQRAKLVKDWRDILDKADAEKRGLSQDEKVKVEKIEADIDGLKAQIDSRAKLDAAERATVPDSQRGAEKANVNTQTDEQRKAEYRAQFWAAMRGGPITSEFRAQALSPDSAGGYTVPDEFRKELIRALDEENVIRKYATQFTTSSGIMTIPVNSAHGSASWKTEAAAYAESDETFSEVTLNAYKGTALIKVSEEILNDSAFNIDSFLATEFGRRLGKLEEEAFIAGSGSGQPTGLIGGTTLGTTATATNAITADELMDLYHALARPYRSRAIWVMKDSTIKMIRKLRTGVTNDLTYLWQPGLSAGEPDTLLGRPVVPSEFMPAATTGLKSVVFGDLSYYYIGDRQSISMQRLVELYAANGQVGFRQFKRTDGKLALATAAYHLIQA